MRRTESRSLEAANWKKGRRAMFLMRCYWPPAMSLAIFLTCSVATHGLTLDGEALLVFKAGLRDPVGILNNWKLTDADPCHWTGVTCSAKKRVINLSLPYSRLWGSISPAIGKLHRLRRLSLHENSLFGDFPVEVGNCSKLRALYLQANFLTGHIPVELGSLSNLVILDISSNALSGTIPSALGNLKKLEYLNISTNFLVGQIPQAGVLANFSGASFAGNLDLCGHQVSRICKNELSSPSVIDDLNANKSKSFNTVTAKASPGYINALLISAMSTMGISFALVVMCFWGYLFYNRFGTKGNFPKQVTSSGLSQKTYVFHGDLPYTSREIMKKIEMLNETDMIGSGGFGMVYKLNMGNNNIFAVKKIEKNGKGRKHIFERELEILGILKHRNLVNLRGYCNTHTVSFLIYDYLPNGNLDRFLHARKPEVPPLNWATRLKIAIGAARALAYLHHDCCPRIIIHRDIKSSNILLDDNFDPHVADFGLAKLLEENESHATTVFAGTFGYLAPEYMQSGRATEKTDVYSFGVLLLELISGKCPTEISFAAIGLNIVGWVDKLMKERRQKDILDPDCEGATNESLDSMLHIASLCVSADPEGRPWMSKVVKMLEAEIMSPCPSDFYESSSD